MVLERIPVSSGLNPVRSKGTHRTGFFAALKLWPSRWRSQKEGPMNPIDREAAIQQITAEISLAKSEGRKQKLVTTWRARLQKEPASLPAFRIDRIIREARKRLIVTSQSSTSPRKMGISRPVTSDQPSWSNGIWPTF
jgi:hypothetical protein